MPELPDATMKGGSARIEAGPEDDGTRLDRFLAGKLGGLTRSRIQDLIREGYVSCGGRPVRDAARKVRGAEAFVVSLPPPVPATPAPERIALDVVYEDADLIVIDKPAGLVVHPAAGRATGTLVNALIAHCGPSLSGIGGVRRPGIVHRLDKETSGLLVVAKSDAAHQGLSAQFAAHGRDGRLKRSYLALVWGAPPRRRGVIDAPLGRSSANRTKMAVVRKDQGRPAVTHYEVLQTFRAGGDSAPLAALMRLELETGRTHQIRVHLAHVGNPVMGDPVYAAGYKASARRLGEQARDALAALDRQALHAAVLGFEHPITGRQLQFERPPPADMQRLLDALAASGPSVG